MSEQRGRGIARIVVGVDGSEHGRAALEWAIRMARGMGSEVTAVFALNTPVYFDTGYVAPAVPVQYDPEWRNELKREFEESWLSPLNQAGVEFDALMEDGRPATVIGSVADRIDADVIVVGRRGRGGVAELLLGSVSHELVQHSRRPVLVISRMP